MLNIVMHRSKVKLEKAMKWESKFIEFMKNWTAHPENTQYMDVAFNSERSIEASHYGFYSPNDHPDSGWTCPSEMTRSWKLIKYTLD